MNPRNLSMLLAIIIGAGLLYYFEKDPYSGPTEVPVAIAAFTRLDVQQVMRIEMMQGTNSVVLERQADSWSVASVWDYPADHQEIDRLLADIRSIAAAHQRASKVASHSTFDVSDEAGLKIALKDSAGQTMTDLVIGKRDGFSRSFIRIAGSNEVYSVSPNLRARAAFAGSTLEAERWTDKVLFRLPADAVVRRMHIETPEGLSQLIWKPSENPPAPQEDENPLVAGTEDPLWMVRSSAEGELRDHGQGNHLVTEKCPGGVADGSERYGSAGARPGLLLHRGRTRRWFDSHHPVRPGEGTSSGRTGIHSPGGRRSSDRDGEAMDQGFAAEGRRCASRSAGPATGSRRAGRWCRGPGS